MPTLNLQQLSLQQTSLQQLSWHLHKAARNLGFWGLFGLAISVAALTLGLRAIHKLDLETAALQLQIAELKKPVSNQHQHTQPSLEQFSAPLPEPAPVRTAASNVADFNALFANAPSLAKQLNTLNQVAVKQGLLINRADYKLVKLKPASSTASTNMLAGESLAQYQMTLPIKAPYLQINRFIFAALQHNPTMALSDLQMSRENALSTYVDARLVFTLFFKEAL